ncbi:MAG: hypothetical protein PHD67_10285 [Oscillospiraceae bacterium]|nr:hypothetical protein [Oscillospiraceae bacterium]
MTYKELLEEYLDREHNNVFCYSANYLMDTPKKGYEKEFAEAVERVEMLETLILANCQG